MSRQVKQGWTRALVRERIERVRAEYDDAEDAFMARGGRAALERMNAATVSMRELAGADFADFDDLGVIG